MARLALAVLAIFLICVMKQGDAAPSLLDSVPSWLNGYEDRQLNSAEAPNSEGTTLSKAETNSINQLDLAQYLPPSVKVVQTLPQRLWNSGAAIANLKLAQNVPEVLALAQNVPGLLLNSGAAIANILNSDAAQILPEADFLTSVENAGPGSPGTISNDLLNGLAEGEALAQNVPGLLGTISNDLLNGLAEGEDLIQTFPEDLVGGDITGTTGFTIYVLDSGAAIANIADVLTSGEKEVPDSPSGDLTSGPNGDAGIQADVPMPVVSAYFQNLQPTFPEVLADVQNAVSGSLSQ